MASARNEAFSRVVIDALLKDVGWDLADGRSVRFEYPLADGTRADYVLCDRHGHSMAVIEAKRASINPADAAGQGRAYAEQLEVPYVFLSNGREIRVWEYQREAHPHEVKTFFSQLDLERRFATDALKRDVLEVPVDTRIVERDYQLDCIDALCREIKLGRRKLLVEMATGTGKTRLAAALIKRLFEANRVTRVLFLVDRIPLALQTEDVFSEHLRDYPCYVLRAGRRFQDEKLATITTLQSMVNIFRDYSAGYFDLVISDECHRSIYGKWRGVLEHFDGVQLGLTATPCVANLETGDDEDNAFIADARPDYLDAAERRLRTRGANVQSFPGEAHAVVDKVVKAIDPRGLHLAFLDPYNLGSLPFSVIQKLASVKRMDLLIHVSAMDLKRDLHIYIRPDGPKDLDEFAPRWRENVNPKGRKDVVRHEIFEYWRSLIKQLGTSPSDCIEVVENSKSSDLYWLVFVSRHPLAHKLWKAIANVSTQGRLFG